MGHRADADQKMVLNPGNPYIHSKSKNGFDTFGGPDFAGTLAEIADRAANAAWYGGQSPAAREGTLTDRLASN